METLLWIALGLIAGHSASRFDHHMGRRRLLDLALGVAGAIAGALAVISLGFPRGRGVAAAGLLGAATGSVVVLAGYRGLSRRA